MAARISIFPRINSLHISLGSLSRQVGFSLAFGLAMMSSSLASAQVDVPPPEVENAKQSFEGKLSVAALVYSGPGNNYYPTMKLPQGATVIVVGIKNQWLKIQPPPGSFSYIPKAFVQAYADGTKGKTSSRSIVKAGSELQPLKYAAQMQLDPKEDVTIIGEDAEYFKIKPPEGAYVYINKDAVQPVGPVPQKNNGIAVVLPIPTTRPGIPLTMPSNPGSTTQPGIARIPTTQPGNAEIVTQLQKLETDFSEASKQPLADQPLTDLQAGYEKLAGTPALPDVAKRIVDARLITLKARGEAREQFAAAQKQQQEFQEKLKAQQAEKDEIQSRIKEANIQLYAAVGTLRASAVQVAKTPIYRLTDPQSGRTVVYVWGTDPKVGELVGQFVGVKGPMQTHSGLNLKVVTPTATDVVDPAKVNVSVAAEIVPPSLMPKGTASTVEPPQ